MQKSVLSIISEIYNNKKKLKTLTVMADRLLRGNGVDVLAQYMTPEDLIFDIAAGVLAGNVKWDRERVPELYNFIFFQLKSRLANIHRKETNNQDVYRSWYEFLSTSEKRKLAAIQTSEEEEEFDLMGISLEEVMKKHEYKDVVEIVQKELESDVIAYFVFELRLRGYKSKGIASELRIPVEEVKRAIKRTDKRIKRIAEQLCSNEWLMAA